MLAGVLVGIMAAFVWSISNLVDKYLVDKYAPTGNIGGVLLLSCFFPLTLLILSAFLAFEGIIQVGLAEAGYSMLAGALMVSWLFFYLKALAEDDTSVVMTLLVLAPFFSLLFAQAILGEFLTFWEIVVGTLLVVGALTVVYEPINKIFKWKLLAYAISASIATGLMNTVFKFTAIDIGVWESLFWRSVGMVAIGLLIFLLSRSYRQDFYEFMGKHFKKAVGLNITNESLTLTGDTLFAFAMLLIPLALLQTTEAYQPIFIFLMVFVLNRFGFSVVTENMERSVLIQKGLGFVLVFSGTVLMVVMG